MMNGGLSTRRIKNPLRSSAAVVVSAMMLLRRDIRSDVFFAGIQMTNDELTSNSNAVMVRTRETPAIPAPVDPALLARLADMVVAAMPSPNTRIMYAYRLRLFLSSRTPLTREAVAQYMADLRQTGASASAVAQTMTAIRRLVEEADLRNLLPDREARGILTLRSRCSRQMLTGTWLSSEHAEAFYRRPDRSTLKGKRDAALFALLMGCGLRAGEAAKLKWETYRLHNGRPCLVDLMGKGRKLRTVPVPTEAAHDLDVWRTALPDQGSPRMPILRSLKGYEGHGRRKVPLAPPDRSTGVLGHVLRFQQPITRIQVWNIVTGYGKEFGLDLSPHDLRRTLAQLMRRAGVALEQIQYILGHSTVVTTELYLGGKIELTMGKAGVDQVEFLKGGAV